MSYWDDYTQKTMVVHDDTKSIVVKYSSTSGKVFKIKFVQKPNPIGFHARLPGDERS